MSGLVESRFAAASRTLRSWKVASQHGLGEPEGRNSTPAGGGINGFTFCDRQGLQPDAIRRLAGGEIARVQ